MTKSRFKKRVAEVLLGELGQPEQWHYVSFADKVFHGVVILKAHGITDAVRLCHALNINPPKQFESTKPSGARPGQQNRANQR